jgi:TonB family protein
MKPVSLNLFFLSLLLSSNTLYSQKANRHLAYEQAVNLHSGNVIVIKMAYSKHYMLGEQGIFITKYTIYNQSKEYLYITAIHDKNNNHIKVDVVDADGGIFSHINTEEYDYSEPTPKAFGIEGNWRVMGGKKYPLQLVLDFPNIKHEYVNVYTINGTSINDNNSYVIAYTLTNEMLTPTPGHAQLTLSEEKISKDIKQNSPDNEDNFSNSNDQNKIYSGAEEEPSFDGFSNFLEKNKKYPIAEKTANIGGNVLMKFVVEKDGSLSNYQILSSPDEILSKEALRVIKLCPKWNPGLQNGKPVRCYYVIPINF